MKSNFKREMHCHSIMLVTLVSFCSEISSIVTLDIHGLFLIANGHINLNYMYSIIETI